MSRCPLLRSAARALPGTLLRHLRRGHASVPQVPFIAVPDVARAAAVPRQHAEQLLSAAEQRLRERGTPSTSASQAEDGNEDSERLQNARRRKDTQQDNMPVMNLDDEASAASVPLLPFINLPDLARVAALPRQRGLALLNAAERRARVSVASAVDEGEEEEESGEAASLAEGIVADEEKLTTLAVALAASEPETRLEAAREVRALLSVEARAPIREVVEAGLVPLLVALLDDAQMPELQFEAAWALTNVASGTAAQTHSVVQAGAVPRLVSLLESGSANVREQSAWALGNVAGDSAACRDIVLRNGAVKALLAAATCPEAEVEVAVRRQAVWALSNFCRGTPPPRLDLIATVLEQLPQLLSANDTQVVADAAWAIAYLCDGSDIHAAAVVRAGVCPQLVALLASPEKSLQAPALRSLGVMATGSAEMTQAVVDSGALPALVKLLPDAAEPLQKEAVWTISNIAAGTREQIQEVLDSGAVPLLVQLLAPSSALAVREEAAWALGNAACSGTPPQVAYLAASGCVPPLLVLLGHSRAELAAGVLRAVERMVHVSGPAWGEPPLDGNAADP